MDQCQPDSNSMRSQSQNPKNKLLVYKIVIHTVKRSPKSPQTVSARDASLNNREYYKDKKE